MGNNMTKHTAVTASEAEFDSDDCKETESFEESDSCFDPSINDCGLDTSVELKDGELDTSSPERDVDSNEAERRDLEFRYSAFCASNISVSRKELGLFTCIF